MFFKNNKNNKNNKSNEKNYRFADLRTYSSTEWLADSRKKYRTVFEKDELTYIYAEFSFYNRLFDTEDWTANIKLKCFAVYSSGEAREQICEIEATQRVSKKDVISYLREGWGSRNKGQIWRRGDYMWEAYIDDVLVGARTFYVEDGGLVTQERNNYFDLVSVKLFESGANPDEERYYYTTFDGNDTRYIWVELNLKSSLTRDWYCEMQFLFHTESGMLKGRSSELKRISEHSYEVQILTAWGADAKGSWFPGRYTLDIIFMDRRIAVVPFEVAEDYEYGVPQILSGNFGNEARPFEMNNTEESEDSLENVMAKLNAMTGLENIKQKISEYTDYLNFVKLRKEHGFDEKEKVNLNAVFTGNPGTGKTTVARLIAKLYHKLGFLSKGKLTEVTRPELVGQYIGQTAPKVKEIIEKARGGVLFIDEAYSLIRTGDDSKDYGHEVVETLIKEMSDGKGDLAIIVAGYPAEMQHFLEANPGFRSRFNLFYDFPDYTPQQLMQIAENYCREADLSFSQGAWAKFNKVVVNEYRLRDRTFGNARRVQQLLTELKMNMATRIMREKEPEKLGKIELMTVTESDVNRLMRKLSKEKPLLGIDDEALAEALKELDEMTGLREVKKQIHELVSLVRFYAETNRDILNKFSLHTVFKGNPGTGKTTVARLLARIYRALGILERGHIVETDREGLVAGFIGQTAIKTKEKIEEAVGGVLFIDEAYALSIPSTQSWDYGAEVIEVLLKQMEDRRGEFIVIVAGYPEKMDKFVETNPGLKSRFDKTLVFEDFTSDELYEIAVSILKKENLQPDEKALEYIRKELNSLYERRDKFFGNARTVRKIVEEVIRKQHLRLAHLAPEERTPDALQQLTLRDVREVRFTDEDASKRKIGFRASEM